jgi:tetratricopeptide (TPR) repeat protein
MSNEPLLNVQYSPEEVQVLTEVGQVYYLRGDYQKAERVFRGVLVMSPGSGDVYSAIGASLHAQGKPDEAIAYYEKALNACPNEPSAKINRAELFLAKGDREAAIKELNAAIELDAGQSFASERAKALLELANKLIEAEAQAAPKSTT